MSDATNYWTRHLRNGSLTRRRFVGGALAAGTGAAAFGLVGCGGDDNSNKTPSSAATTTAASPSSSASATASASAATSAGTPQKGGTARLVSANNTWDTFDIDRSRFSPVAWLFGLTNLGIIQWKSFTNTELEGAFASKWEQTDPQTLILTLRDNLFWHDKPPVNGRQATADDMAYFITRNKESKDLDGTVDTNFYRATSFQNVDTVTVTDPKTVTVKFKQPDPFFVSTLAGSYSKVQAPEAIKAFEKDYGNLKASLIIGTGGFVLTDWAAEGKSTWQRFDKFYTQVNFDGIQWFPLFTDETAQQAAFEQRQLDSFIPTQVKVINDLQSRLKGQINVKKAFQANPQAGTYAAQQAPWNDPRRIGAIFIALDRRSVVNSLLQGQAALSGNIPPAQSAYGITEKELITFQGYKEDRAQEEKDAKAMWEAGGGPALGDITVDIPDIWEGLYSGGSALITTQLKKVLGNNFNAKIENYTTISTKVTKAQYGNGNNNIWYGWVTDITDPEPTLGNYLVYNSSQPQWKQFGVKSDKIDQLTLQAIQEFDREKRKTIDMDVDRELLRNWGAGIPYTLLGISNVFAWNYFKYPEAVPFVTQHQYAQQYYMDQTDPTWKDRPA